MSSRRQFLQAAAIAALPATLATQVAASQVAHLSGQALHAALVDERLAASRGFAARFTARGTPVLSLREDDVTALWLDHIRPLWSRTPATLAGLTTRPVLFCLEQLAWSQGLRVVFHAEHVLHADGTVRHQLLRGARQAGLAPGDLARPGALWPTRLAAGIIRHREGLHGHREGPSAAALEPALPDSAQLVTSWVIAAV